MAWHALRVFDDTLTNVLTIIFGSSRPFEDAPFLHVSRVNRLQINKHNTLVAFMLLFLHAERFFRDLHLCMHAVIQQQTVFLANFTHFISHAEKHESLILRLSHTKTRLDDSSL